MRSSKLILILTLALAAVGCGKDKNGGGSSNATAGTYEPYIPPGSGPGGDPGLNWEYGGTAPLTVTNTSLGYYVGRTPNNPTEVKVNINLQKFAPAAGSTRSSYGGVVSISFKDSGILWEDKFTSLMNESHWYGQGTVRTNEENNKYNVWIQKNGESYWHGFFQDNFGAIIVVIDDSDDRGDGSGPTKVSGSIWVMNFGRSYAYVSPTSCWYVYAGPYDCRTWKNGNAVNTDKDIYPYLENSNPGTATAPRAVGYRKVGDFTNLEFKKAFNDTLQ